MKVKNKESEPFSIELKKEVIKAVVIALILALGAILYDYYMNYKNQDLEFRSLKAEINTRIILLKAFDTAFKDDKGNLVNLLEKILNNNYSSLGIVDKYKSDSFKCLMIKYLIMAGEKNLMYTNKGFFFEIYVNEILIADKLSYEEKKDKFHTLLVELEEECKGLSKLKFNGYVYGPILDK